MYIKFIKLYHTYLWSRVTVILFEIILGTTVQFYMTVDSITLS